MTVRLRRVVLALAMPLGAVRAVGGSSATTARASTLPPLAQESSRTFRREPLVVAAHQRRACPAFAPPSWWATRAPWWVAVGLGRWPLGARPRDLRAVFEPTLEGVSRAISPPPALVPVFMLLFGIGHADEAARHHPSGAGVAGPCSTRSRKGVRAIDDVLCPIPAGATGSWGRCGWRVASCLRAREPADRDRHAPRRCRSRIILMVISEMFREARGGLGLRESVDFPSAGFSIPEMWRRHHSCSAWPRVSRLLSLVFRVFEARAPALASRAAPAPARRHMTRAPARGPTPPQGLRRPRPASVRGDRRSELRVARPASWCCIVGPSGAGKDHAAQVHRGADRSDRRRDRAPAVARVPPGLRRRWPWCFRD